MHFQGRSCPTLGSVAGPRGALDALALRPQEIVLEPYTHVGYGIIELIHYPQGDTEIGTDFTVGPCRFCRGGRYWKGCKKYVLESSDLQTPRTFGLQRIHVLLASNHPFLVTHRGLCVPEHGVPICSVEIFPRLEGLEDLDDFIDATGHLEILGPAFSRDAWNMNA